jgi:hypothetical protein
MVLPEKLIVAQLLKKSPSLYGTRLIGHSRVYNDQIAELNLFCSFVQELQTL